jgi:hypothetical protein
MEIRIQIERARYDEQHLIKPCSNPNSNTEVRYIVSFQGKEIGRWRDPECSAARYLVDNGLASREDTLQTYHGDDPQFRGQVGWLADRRVAEDDANGGAPHFVKWTPNPFTDPARTPKKTASKRRGV